jgi:hypothetical protein
MDGHVKNLVFKDALVFGAIVYCNRVRKMIVGIAEKVRA